MHAVGGWLLATVLRLPHSPRCDLHCNDMWLGLSSTHDRNCGCGGTVPSCYTIFCMSPARVSTPMSRRFRPDWSSGLLLLLLLPPLLWLGHWQTRRAEEKRDWLDRRQAALSAPPMQLSAARALLREGHSLAFRRLLVVGSYDPDPTWYLDNRIFGRRPGFERLGLLRSDDGIALVVNRGWAAPGPGGPRELPPPMPPPMPPPGVRLSVFGVVHVPARAPFALGRQPELEGWPKLIQVVDVAVMERQLGEPLFPYVLRLDPGQPGVTPATWQRRQPPPALSPQRHLGYAVTWYALALVLSLLWLARSWGRIEEGAPAAVDKSL